MEEQQIDRLEVAEEGGGGWGGAMEGEEEEENTHLETNEI